MYCIWLSFLYTKVFFLHITSLLCFQFVLCVFSMSLFSTLSSFSPSSLPPPSLPPYFPHVSLPHSLPVASPPTMVSAQQVAPGSSISVTWMAPSGGATVTGYTVHYSGGGDTGSVNVGLSTTATTITGRNNNGLTYTITVEAKSMHLSGESTAPVTLGEWSSQCAALS